MADWQDVINSRSLWADRAPIRNTIWDSGFTDWDFDNTQWDEEGWQVIQNAKSVWSEV